MSIKTEYRMHFDSKDGNAESSLEIAASGGPDDLSVYLSQPSAQEPVEWIIQMTRQETLELRAILGVLTGTASSEEEAMVRGAS